MVVAQNECEGSNEFGSGDFEPEWYGGFYEYYQVYKGDENNESEAGAKISDELIAVGLNSVWGVMHTLMKELNMTWDEIMWERSWLNIEMMLGDSARMAKGKQVKQVNDDELRAIFGK
jgi:hypothetical protein